MPRRRRIKALSGCAFTLRACSAATRRWSCTEVATPGQAARENLFGEDEDVLYVKGSGWDLETIEAAGFTPVTLSYVRRLAALERLPDPQMVNELNTHMLRAGAPSPSVETILHAILPHTYVDHTHADAVLAVSNAPEGDKRIREIYGDRVVVIPYIMAGFDLATYCARVSQAGARTRSAWCCSRTASSRLQDARESYERMIELVSMAENTCRRKRPGTFPFRRRSHREPSARTCQSLRRAMSDQAGFR